MNQEEYQAWIDHPLTQKALEEANSEYSQYSDALLKGVAEAEGKTEANYCRMTGYLRGVKFMTERLPAIIKQRESKAKKE